MIKILLWIVVIFAVLFGLRLLNVAKTKRHAGSAGRNARRTPPAETMVRCARCGVYLPRADAKPGPSGLTCGEPGCALHR
jgi:uncharacterized protein